ncbi:MAG: prepilin-type N-terminal cleavage/methylation domain-containing protein [Candidatus Kerfeldbacteria bacterium]|nr:prepilin-type N-terminal cleavage/methylation domain-containing protein [Candidatus Kerfeldbacteria bacterium]
MVKIPGGYTALELIVAITVMAILMGATFTSFRSGESESELQAATDQLEAHLRLLQQRAQSSVVTCGTSDYGIQFSPTGDPTRYRLFADCPGGSDDVYDVGDIMIYTGESEFSVSNVEINEWFDGTNSHTSAASILFKSLTRDLRVNGVEPAGDDRVSILLKHSSGGCKRIDLESSSHMILTLEDSDCDSSTP